MKPCLLLFVMGWVGIAVGCSEPTEPERPLNRLQSPSKSARTPPAAAPGATAAANSANAPCGPRTRHADE